MNIPLDIVSRFFDFLHDLGIKTIGVWGMEEDKLYLTKLSENLSGAQSSRPSPQVSRVEHE